MKHRTGITIFFLLIAFAMKAQNTLPEITVKEVSGKIVISWKNEYNLPVSTINIQRSWDRLKNYTTIGSVLNPANMENGFADGNAPYDRMYYRVFIGFENGSYILTEPRTPEADPDKPSYGGIIYDWQVHLPPAPKPKPEPEKIIIDSIQQKIKINPIPVGQRPMPSKIDTLKTKVFPLNPIKEIKLLIQYVYLNKDNNITLFLPGAPTKGYVVRFTEEAGKQVFELNKLKEENLIIEKFNFIHSGWFNYEVYERSQLVGKDKIFIAKDIYKSEQKRQ